LIQILFSKTIFDNNKSYWTDKNSYWGGLNRYYPDHKPYQANLNQYRVVRIDIGLIECNIRASATDSPPKNSSDGHHKPGLRFSNFILAR
jgi:hypothetical protein